MSKLTGVIEFGADSDPDEATKWFAGILASLPAGSTGRIQSDSVLVDLEDVDELHIGHKVRFHHPHDGDVEGTLEQVMPGGRHGDARVLLVDGRAYYLTYAVVQIADW